MASLRDKLSESTQRVSTFYDISDPEAKAEVRPSRPSGGTGQCSMIDQSHEEEKEGAAACGTGSVSFIVHQQTKIEKESDQLAEKKLRIEQRITDKNKR